MLSQRDAEGQNHPVAASYLIESRNTSQLRKNVCMAIKLVVKAFQMYLLDWPFIIQTDHWTLQWLNNVKDENSCLVRWSLALQSYQFEIKYRKGRANANADPLSRILYSRQVLCTGEEGENVIEPDLQNWLTDLEAIWNNHVLLL